MPLGLWFGPFTEGWKMKGRRVGYGASALAAWLIACGGAPIDPVASDPECALPAELGSASYFEDASLVSYRTGAVETGRTVVVEDGRITAVGSATDVTIPDGAVRVPACGRFLVPGLADMHVHLSRTDIPAYLDAGVTTVRNLWGFPDLLAMRDEIGAGTLEGPTVYVMSSGLDGTPAKWPLTQLVMDVGEAAPIIDAQEAQGYRTLKLYSDLRPEPFDEIIEEAQDRGLQYGGHVPYRVGLRHALASGYRFIEHLSGYEVELGTGQLGAFGWSSLDEDAMNEFVGLTLAAGTWNSPTLEIFAQIASYDETIVENRQRVVRALYDAGAPLLIGTDSGIGRTVPGLSLHQEMAQFAAAGISNREVLRIATEEAARFLGEEDEFGRVAVGLRADLLLVASNPIEELGAVSDPVAVVRSGSRVR